MVAEIVPLDPHDNNSAWLECLQRWLEAVERRRGSARTREEYTKNVKGFFAFLEVIHPAQVTGADCQRWTAAMQEKGLSKATIKTRLGAVSSFYAFACTKYEVAPGRYLHNFNPASSVTRPLVNPYERAQGLSPEQARAMLKSCDRTTVLGRRDYALLMFYLYTGRRRAEIARLRWGDIRKGDGITEYRYIGKGGRGGWRELPQPVWTAIESYLLMSERRETMQADTPLFVATNDKARNLGHEIIADQPIGERTVGQIVSRAAEHAGLGHVKVHTLRHTAAKMRRKTGASLEEVQKFLDHSSIATTQIYLNAVEAAGDPNWRAVEALIGIE